MPIHVLRDREELAGKVPAADHMVRAADGAAKVGHMLLGADANKKIWEARWATH